MSGAGGFAAGLRSWSRRLLGRDLLAAVLVLALVCAAVYGAYRVVAARTEDEAVAGAVNVAERDARILVEYWSNVQDRVTRLQTMANSVTLAQVSGDDTGMQRALDTLKAALSVSLRGFVVVAAVDPRGFVMWSTQPALDLPIDVSDREHVQAILKQGQETFVGQPVVGRVSGQRTIQFAAAQRSDDGALIGVGVVSFDLTRALELEKRLTHRSRDLITLVRGDGMLLASSVSQGVGMKLPSLTAPIPRDDGGTVLFARRASRIDGVRRIFVRMPVQDSDLSVAVGLDEETALASAMHFQRRLRIGAYLFCLMAALLAGAAVIVFRLARNADAKASREALLHQIADRSHDIIGVLDHDFRYLFVNDSVQALLGVAASELIGQPAGGLVLPEYRKAVIAKLRSLSGTDDSYRVTAPFAHRNGGEIWLEYDICHIRLPGSDPAGQDGWFFIGRDVSARKAVETELARVHEDLSTLAQTGPGTLYRVLMTEKGPGQILYSSRNVKLLLGYDDAVWRAPGFVLSHIHPDDKAKNNQFVADLRRHGTAVAEYRVLHQEGHYVWIRDTATSKAQADGSYVLSGFAQDVTREKAQAAQLDQARRLLSLGELASGLGHELGQPLMAISLAAENGRLALQREPARIELARNKFHQILRMTERAGNIIDSMRTVGRAESGTSSWLNLSDLVADIMGVMEDRLHREAIHIHADVPSTLPKVMVAPMLFQQVLINLLANACDAYTKTPVHPTGEKTIRIEGHAEDNWVRLRIMDQAGGVPAAVIEHIFDPFFTTKGRDKGTGLGLSICYGIIRQAGGTLGVHNARGGAVFEILLPASGGASGRVAGSHAA